MAHPAHTRIRPGHCFKKNGIAWEVVDFKYLNGINHVHITKVGDPMESKLISVNALRGEDYNPAPR